MCEILFMLTLLRQKIKGNNDLNAMYVDRLGALRAGNYLDPPVISQ